MTSSKIKLLGVTFISVFIITLIVTLYVFQGNQDRHQQILAHHQAEVLGHLLQQDLGQQLKAVRHFKLYLASKNDIPQHKFNHFSSRLMGEYDYIRNIEWGVNVQQAARKEFEDQLSSLYHTPIEITERGPDGTLQKAALRDQYLAIKYVYPFYENKAAIGFDPSIGKGQLNNLAMAINSHSATLSGKIYLAQQQMDNHSPSIAVYIPVFADQKELLGFLTLILDIEKLLKSILNDSQLNDIVSSHIRLVDTTYSVEKVLYETSAFAHTNTPLSASTEIRIANRTWRLELLDISVSPQSHNPPLHSFIVWAGLAISLLVILFMTFLIRQLSQAEKKLHDKEEELIESHAASSLLTVTFEAHQAIAITDIAGNILRVNKAFCEITGYSEPEVIGENPRILSSGRQSQEFYQNMWYQLQTFGKYAGEIWNRRKNGEVYPEMQTITAIKDRSGNTTHYVSLFTDITKQKQHEEKEKNLVLYDPLTLLANRRLFIDRLDKQVAESKRYNSIGAVLIIDIDDFEVINQKVNYHNGDDVLIELSSRLVKSLRNTDSVARIEGDEFAVLIPVRANMAELISNHVLCIAEKIQQSLTTPFIIDSQIIHVKVSIGIALIYPEKDAGAAIIRQARSAMFKAKTMGKNRIVFDSIDGDESAE